MPFGYTDSENVESAPSAPGREGNISPLSNKAKKINSSKKWVFTWHNYPEDHTIILRQAFEATKVEKWIFGREVCPTTGGLHLQGFIEFEEKNRWSALKLPKGIWWGKCKGTAAQNLKYCSKDGDYDASITMPRPLVRMTKDMLRPWQSAIADLFVKPEDPLFGRSIYWFWEPDGNIGKSILATYFADNTKDIMVSGKANDMKFGVTSYVQKNEEGPDLIIVDIPRSIEQRFVSFTGIEEIKNGLFFNGKYESAMVRYNRPHVVCFANCPPDISQCSLDRWHIHNVNEWAREVAASTQSPSAPGRELPRVVGGDLKA